MAILFAGGEADALTPSGPDAYEYVPSSSLGAYDTTFARCVMRVDGTDDYWQTSEWTDETDLWLHCEYYPDTLFVAGTYYRHISIFDSSDNETFRVTVAREGIRLAYSDGLGGFTTLGTLSTSTTDNKFVLDLRVQFSASGGATLYSSGTKRLEVLSTDLSGLAGGAYARFYGGGKVYWSQIIASDESTIGKRLKTVVPTGAGSDTAWVGDYARVDEITYSDVDFVNSDTAAQVETFTHSVTIPSGYVVDEVIVSARANKGGSGPQNLQLALRSSGTNYFSASKALDAGYLTYQNIWSQDPATASDWLNSGAQAIQFGVKSIT